MGNSKFVNVNINVDGKIYKAKVQEGFMLNGCYLKNNTIFESNTPEYGTEIWKIGNNEFKMNKSDFALFKNIADNHDEKMGLTLSRKDFDIAIDLFYAGKFTNDIKKNLPEGDYAEPSMQDRDNDTHLYAASNNGRLALGVPDDEGWRGRGLDLDFIVKHLGDKITDEVYYTYNGDGYEGACYFDKEGWSHSTIDDCKYRTTTDSEGNVIEERIYSDKTKSTQITKPDGTKEYYKNNRLNRRTYTKDNKNIQEDYKNGILAQKVVTWDGNTRIYNGKNELLEERTGKYYKKYTNGKVSEELKNINGSDCYYKNGKLQSVTKEHTTQKDEISTTSIDKQTIKQRVSDYIIKNNPYFNKYEKLDSKTIANELKEQIRFFSKGEKTAEMLDAIPFEKRAEVLAEYKDMTGNNLFEDLYDEWGIEESNIKQFMKDFYQGYISNKKSHNGEDLKMLKVSNSENITKEEILNLEQYILNNP